MSTNQVQINTLALNARLPTMHAIGEYVKAGGLMSYGANVPDLWRRGGDYVDKILRGAKPGDIPVEPNFPYSGRIASKIKGALRGVSTTLRGSGLDRAFPPAVHLPVSGSGEQFALAVDTLAVLDRPARTVEQLAGSAQQARSRPEPSLTAQ